MVEKALVIGSGFLGSYIIKAFENCGIRTVGTHFNNCQNHAKKVDVTDIDSINGCVTEIKPDIIINCAANGNIDYLENNPELAFSINSYGVKNIATISNKHRIKIIHISTDSIFDGKKGMYTEEDIPHPLNVYAKSKVLAEELVKENSDDHVIIRTNFYGFNPRGTWFFNWVLTLLQQNKQLTGFNNIFFNPLEVSNLSQMILDISKTSYKGIIHLASNEIINKYQFILKVAEIFEFNTTSIKEGYYDKNVYGGAERPLNTTLDNKKAMRLFNPTIMSLTDSLKKIKETI